MDFWDHLTFVTLITVRDYYHDKVQFTRDHTG